MSTTKNLALVVGLLMFSVIVLEASGQDQAYVTVDDARPVAAAVHELTARYGYLITYEDPRYAYVGDVKDVTSEVRREAMVGGERKILVPFGGLLSVSYPLASAGASPDTAFSVVNTVLDAQAATARGGTFRLLQAGKMLHVVPAQIRDITGKLVVDTPILNLPITLGAQERSTFETLNEICTLLAKKSGERIDLGIVPINFVAETRSTIGARNETARDVLRKVLDATGARIVWDLYFDPGLRWHVLNLRVIPDTKPATRLPVTAHAPFDPTAKSPTGAAPAERPR